MIRAHLNSDSRLYVTSSVAQLFFLHFHERECFYTKPGSLQNGQLVTLAELSK